MAEFESPSFPLVTLRAAAGVQHDWMAITVRADTPGALAQIFATPDLLAALAPLDCIVLLAQSILDTTLLNTMPAARVLFALNDPAKAQALQAAGYRILIDGPALPGRAVIADCRAGIPIPACLSPDSGPHLACHVDSAERLQEAVQAGFTWFSGDYALERRGGSNPDDVTSRKRLLALLGLLARDADSRELEALLKQDPALSYHLLKLVNSAAFAASTPIYSFNQAINVLGRRQLQRWLQLLLYARPQQSGPANPLLAIAALRAAHLEVLCKLAGGERDAQDLAFMTGVFSLLDVLLGMPMDEIVATLSLPHAAAEALLTRAGELGRLLVLVEDEADGAMLASAGIGRQVYWQSQLHAYHWAIQVGRNL